jgi:hypothetical protein
MFNTNNNGLYPTSNIFNQPNALLGGLTTPPPPNPYAPLYNQGNMDVTAFPGIFGQDTSAQSLGIGNQLKDLLAPGNQSPYQGALQKALLNPTFGPQNPMEQSFMNSIADMTQGTSAARGLGPATPGALGSALAPGLMQLYQNHIQNLSGAYGQDMANKSQNIQGLLNLAGYAMPQYTGSPHPQVQGDTAGSILGGLGSLGMGAYALSLMAG